MLILGDFVEKIEETPEVKEEKKSNNINRRRQLLLNGVHIFIQRYVHIG